MKKKNGKGQVCVNFTDLNKACLKDPFPIPKIDQLVDVTFGHPRMSFLDAFQRYNQIALAPRTRRILLLPPLQVIFITKSCPSG